MNDLLSVAQTVRRAKAENIPITRARLDGWLDAGLVPYVPNGRRREIYWPALLDFIQRGQMADTTPRPRYGPGSRGGKRRV